MIVNLTITAQTPIDPGIDGKTINSIIFEDNFRVTFNTAEGVGRLRPRGINGLVQTVDVRTGEIINYATDKKGIYLLASDENGNYLLRRAGGAVINPIAKQKNGFQVIIPRNKEVGTFEIIDKTAYQHDWDSQYFINGRYFIIGPKHRGFKMWQKNKADKPVEWLLNYYTIDGMKKNTISFFPKGLSGSQIENGYVLLDVNDENFTLLSKSFSDKSYREADTQNILISVFNFKGVLVKETTLTLSIDNSKQRFVGASLERARIRGYRGGTSFYFYTCASLATVYYNEDDDTFLICAILDGKTKKDKDKVTALLVKKDSNDVEIWSSYVDIFGEDPGKNDIGHTEFYPLIAGGKVFYRKKEYRTRNEEGVIIGVLDYTTGEVIQTITINKLKGISELDDTKGDYLRGRIIKDELSDNIILDPDAILAYGINNKVKEFLKSENPDSRMWYYAHINEDSSISLFRADHKNKIYRLYFFNF